MICDYCGKNEATIHFIKIFDNNDIEKVNLCRNCAEKISFLPEEDFFSDLTKIISKIFGIDIGCSKDNEQSKLFDRIGSKKEKRCSNCGIDLRTIKKIGRVGCARCYKEFRDELFPLIKAIHSSLEHKGKIPVNSNQRLKIEKEIKDLKYKLEEEIVIENFEEAAKLRDVIRKLQRKLHTSGKRSGKNK